MKEPVFSIITPTFRRPLLLKRALLSVMTQTIGDYEHIIVDDANDEGTSQLVRSFHDERMVYHWHETSKGAAAGYNSGMKLSRGRYILFLDDDDEYLPEFLEKMHLFFSMADPAVGFAWAGITRIRDTDAGEEVILEKTWPAAFPDRQAGLVEATSIGNGFGVCVKRECIDRIGWYDESLVSAEDSDFLFRLARNYDFGTVPEVLVKIHQHSQHQLTDKKNDLMRLGFRMQVLQRHLELLLEYPKLYYVHFKVVADVSFRLGLRKQGRQTAWAIIRNTPFRLLNYTDLLFYELFGRNTLSCYRNSKIRTIVRRFKR